MFKDLSLTLSTREREKEREREREREEERREISFFLNNNLSTKFDYWCLKPSCATDNCNGNSIRNVLCRHLDPYEGKFKTKRFFQQSVSLIYSSEV
jgi:hypothetical protein